MRLSKGLNEQLGKRQTEIARQISEVSTLYEEAKTLLVQAEKDLEHKKEEAALLKADTLKEIERKKQTFTNNIKVLQKRYEADLHQKMGSLEQKYSEKLIKKLLEESCAHVESALEKRMDQSIDRALIKGQIEKLTL